MKLKLVHKGGAGSGHHGHSGRPGKRGGSAPGKGGGGGGRGNFDAVPAKSHKTIANAIFSYVGAKPKRASIGETSGGRYVSNVKVANLKRLEDGMKANGWVKSGTDKWHNGKWNAATNTWKAGRSTVLAVMVSKTEGLAYIPPD